MNIKKSPTGKIISVPAGYKAFLPNPLPPIVRWTDELVHAHGRANHLLGMLFREGIRLPNPHLLVRPFTAREAVLSSQIEGIQATVGEVLAHGAGVHVESPDLKEVQNYVDALDYGIRFPLSLRLIKELHGKLMEGFPHATPGEFRRTQNWIGLPGCTLKDAKYIPPAPEDLMPVLSTFESFLYDEGPSYLLHLAMTHYQFEAIHPFLDGNGRVGRLLIMLLLIKRKLLPGPILYLSAYFEATRSEYYRLLYAVSSEGAWDEWFIYFLRGIELQAADALERAEEINNILIDWQLQVAAYGIPVEVIHQLAENPFITIKGLAKKKEVAYTTAARLVDRLESLGIVSKIDDKKRNRAYCAKKILAILERPTKLSD